MKSFTLFLSRIYFLPGYEWNTRSQSQLETSAKPGPDLAKRCWISFLRRNLLLGNQGRETRDTKTSRSFTTDSRRYRGKTRTNWHECVRNNKDGSSQPLRGLEVMDIDKMIEEEFDSGESGENQENGAVGAAPEVDESNSDIVGTSA